MSEIPSLTLNFAGKHPLEAARVLQNLAVEDTVAFIEKIPPEMGSKLLERLTPHYAGKCLLTLDRQFSATLMHGMKITSAISMLRIIPTVSINSFLEFLSPEKSALLKTGLSFPENSVGAWMDLEKASVNENALVGDIRRSFRISRNMMEYAPCVVRSNGTIAGLISLSRMATAKDSSKVSKIITVDFVSIPVHDSLQSVISLDAWNHFDALPVINPNERFAGMLTLKNLKRGLSLSTGSESSHPADSILADSINAYISALTWLATSAFSSSAKILPGSYFQEGNRS